MFGLKQSKAGLRRLTTIFGSMFDDIVVERRDDTGRVVQSINVPIEYGPKEKWISRSRHDPDLERVDQVNLPRMGFELSSLLYDGTRKTAQVTRDVRVNENSGDLMTVRYSGVPYEVGYALYVYIRNAEDGHQILEQIMPYFTPSFTLSKVKIDPYFDARIDIPFSLVAVGLDDQYEGDYVQKRVMVWTLQFVARSYLYMPNLQLPVVKRAISDLTSGRLDANSAIALSTSLQSFDYANTYFQEPRRHRVLITPALLANGSPTTNSAASVPSRQIFASNSYGLAQDFFFFEDGWRYDPVSGEDSEGSES